MSTFFGTPVSAPHLPQKKPLHFGSGRLRIGNLFAQDPPACPDPPEAATDIKGAEQIPLHAHPIKPRHIPPLIPPLEIDKRGEEPRHILITCFHAKDLANPKAAVQRML